MISSKKRRNIESLLRNEAPQSKALFLRKNHKILPKAHGITKKRGLMIFNFSLFDAKRLLSRWILARNSCEYYSCNSVFIACDELWRVNALLWSLQ